MDNKLLSEVVNELHNLNTVINNAAWNAKTHDELLLAVDDLQEDLDKLIDHIQYQQFSLELHKD